jgi:EmrB/QacA subfamily drug resistance transporter
MDPHGLHKLLHPLWFGLVHSALIRELRPRVGERVLDVGAGTGVLAERISATGATVVCIDPDDASLAAAEKRLAGRGAEFVAAPAESIPLPDASADGAVVSLSAHHWQDRDEGFGEIARVLRPGGRLVMAEFRPAGPVRSVIRRLGGGKHSGAPDAAAWTASLAQAGFADAHAVTAGRASPLALIIEGRKNQTALQVPRSRAAAAAVGEPAVTSGRLWLVLAAVVFGLFMPMLDHLVVNVALPTIQHQLGAGISGLQWIVDAYTLTFAAFMLTGGTLGDRYGRKRFFLAGLALFSLASALAGVSASPGQLVAARALQGVGAALLLPGSLSIISATFPSGKRGLAIGVWGAISGLAIAVGPVVGGYLVEHASWRSVFFINVPVGVVGLILAAAVVPESRDQAGHRHLDPPGLIAGTAAVSALTYALIEGNARGWTDGRILAAFAAAAVATAAFAAIEARRESSMLPVGLLRNRTFAGANIVGALMFFGMIGTIFFLTLYLQDVRGYSPAQAGLRLLPLSGMILVFAPVAGKLSDRVGSRGFMTVGPALTAAGLGLLALTGPGTPYTSVLLPAFLAMGAGWAITLAPMSTAVMGSAEPGRAGLASAAANTSRELGGVLGVASLGALTTAVFNRDFLAHLAKAGISAGPAARIAARAGSSAATGGSAGASQLVRDAIQQSFVHAMHAGIVAAAVAMLCASVVSFVLVRSHVTLAKADEREGS